MIFRSYQTKPKRTEIPNNIYNNITIKLTYMNKIQPQQNHFFVKKYGTKYITNVDSIDPKFQPCFAHKFPTTNLCQAPIKKIARNRHGPKSKSYCLGSDTLSMRNKRLAGESWSHHQI